jgi:FtsP/CotA-like multicopper oxidase with cupredoxin domain
MAMSGVAMGQALPGGTLDPNSIPKYVTPLVIPPVMNDTGNANDYDIAVRQFQQQILPGGIWNTINGRTDAFPATPIWSYGPAAEDRAAVATLVAPSPASQFNYPAYTVEATKDTTVTVDWVNDLIDPATGNYRPHLLPIDRTLHWANPEGLACDAGKIKDCRPDPMALKDPEILQKPYAGPVPIVVHVHGAHVGPESDGYPEAWWLPDANNIPAGYSTVGTLVNQYAFNTNNAPGVASFTYPNDQPSTTLWYHDHTLGMTRNNVYAGPAGFWLIREAGGGETGLGAGNVLPGPAPAAGDSVLELNVPGDPVRAAVREIPVVIQDRSFNADGSLFYPANRAFFEGLGDGQDAGGSANPQAGLKINTIGKDKNADSDIAPIWNPEAFFNVMVVNGVSWPELEVEPDLYRLRLLNGCNSRFLNLSLHAYDADGNRLGEVPFYQIGAEQSLMPNVVKIVRGARAALPGDGTNVALTAAAYDPAMPEETVEGLVMGLAERADTIVDFNEVPTGTAYVMMLNTAPDAPFGGFPDIPSDPATSGQVMKFTLVADTDAGEGFTAPADLQFTMPETDDPAFTGEGVTATRDLALLEEESIKICALTKPDGSIVQDEKAVPDGLGNCVDKKGNIVPSLPFGPMAAVLGTNGSGGGTVQLWADPIRQNVGLGNTEEWELWNWSADAHPIHLHLVKFMVLGRSVFDANGNIVESRDPELTELGWKDTVIAYPGEMTKVRATFDLPGLYVWHCHIVEHEDNEMMVPFCVGDGPGCDKVPQGL